jgi:hypothetical protein
MAKVQMTKFEGSALAAPLSTSLRDTDPGKTSTYGRHFANVAPSSTENAVFGKPTDLAKTKNLPRKLHVSSFVKDVERGAALADAICGLEDGQQNPSAEADPTNSACRPSVSSLFIRASSLTRHSYFVIRI